MEHKYESTLLEMVNFSKSFIKCQYFNDGKTIFTKIGNFIENRQIFMLIGVGAGGE